VRIVVFNWRCFRHPQAGGSELYLHKQAALWAESGHEVVWITSRPRDAPRSEEKDGIRFVRRGGTYTVYPAAMVEFLRHSRSADVVIDVENGIPFFTALFARCPVVLLIHHVHTDVWSREAGWLMAKVGRWLEQKAMPWVYRACPIVTVSDSSAGMIRKLFRNKEHSLKIVYNGVSEDLCPGQKAERPEIVYLGRLKKYKSIDVLLEAVANLSDLNPVLHLAGQGDDEPRLKALADSLGLKDVVFHGFVSDEKKRELLQRSWVAVNPSSMEGWGVTNIEANACGTPVVGADVPGIRDSIADGTSGVLVPHADVDALTDALRGLIGDPARLEQISESSMEWAGNFSWERSADRLFSVLQRAVFLEKKESE